MRVVQSFFAHIFIIPARCCRRRTTQRYDHPHEFNNIIIFFYMETSIVIYSDYNIVHSMQIKSFYGCKYVCNNIMGICTARNLVRESIVCT